MISQPLSSKGSRGAAAVSPKVWLTGKPMTWNAARLATQDTVTSMSCATAKSPAPTGAPFVNNWTFVAGRAAAAHAGQVGLRRGLRVGLRVGEGAGQRRGPDRVPGGRAHLPGQVQPLAAGGDQQQEQHQGGRRDHELDRHRAAVVRWPFQSLPQRCHPQATPWLAWVRKHSIGPVTVSLMVSGQMPVSLPLIVTETMPLLRRGAACAVTPEIRLVFRPR